MLSKEAIYTNFIVWLDPTGARTQDLLHSVRASITLQKLSSLIEQKILQCWYKSSSLVLFYYIEKVRFLRSQD